ncbi:DUF3040 domain-containing protein [Streptomyces cucumeris]|uniref:DUF3040 domain-containing protein n=1 Tax=Streptomyces cucumeris TaxID=2962890 RepID=UPI0020C86054|nr:DUF3040 domain-containing protein [Streptomyces sp. NEAU-Y11]MCP9211817.1 DUF3040 domain-containing protein [Streptomyces sp. NEAU-Y11]
MAPTGDTLLTDLAERTERSAPRFARGLGTGQPRRPREYRRGPAWILLAVSLAMLALGLALPHGLLLASGLVTTGAAVHLLTSAGGQRADRPR